MAYIPLQGVHGSFVQWPWWTKGLITSVLKVLAIAMSHNHINKIRVSGNQIALTTSCNVLQSYDCCLWLSLLGFPQAKSMGNWQGWLQVAGLSLSPPPSLPVPFFIPSLPLCSHIVHTLFPGFTALTHICAPCTLFPGPLCNCTRASLCLSCNHRSAHTLLPQPPWDPMHPMSSFPRLVEFTPDQALPPLACTSLAPGPQGPTLPHLWNVGFFSLAA